MLRQKISIKEKKHKITHSSDKTTIYEYTPKNNNKRDETYTHSHDEFIYVLKGSIDLLYDDKKYRIHQGDTAYFKGTIPHLFIPIDNQGAEVLTLFIEI